MKKSGAVLLTIGLATALHNAYMTALLLIWAIRDRYSHGVVVPLESVLIGPLLIPNGRPFFQMVLWSTFPYYTQTIVAFGSVLMAKLEVMISAISCFSEDG